MNFHVRRLQVIVLRNRFLPVWVHRLANGVIGGLLSLVALVAAVGILGVPLGVLWAALPVTVGGMALNPRWFTLVEGCAGDLGYDELLDSDAGKADDGTWAEALDA